MSNLPSLPVTAIVAALMLALSSLHLAAPAEARSGRHHMAMGVKPMHHHHHRHWRHVAPLVVVAPSYSCDHYWSMWKRTGSPHWRTKYYVCIG